MIALPGAEKILTVYLAVLTLYSSIPW